MYVTLITRKNNMVLILTREQRRARRRGIKEPEVTYKDESGKAVVILDPSADEFVDETTTTTTTKKPRKKAKAKSKPKEDKK